MRGLEGLLVVPVLTEEKDIGLNVQIRSLIAYVVARSRINASEARFNARPALCTYALILALSCITSSTR